MLIYYLKQATTASPIIFQLTNHSPIGCYITYAAERKTLNKPEHFWSLYIYKTIQKNVKILKRDWNPRSVYLGGLSLCKHRQHDHQHRQPSKLLIACLTVIEFELSLSVLWKKCSKLTVNGSREGVSIYAFARFNSKTAERISIKFSTGVYTKICRTNLTRNLYFVWRSNTILHIF
jgi:hypothetical protein